jgi:hypothetical protein
MTRAELFSLATALPIGALALVPEKESRFTSGFNPQTECMESTYEGRTKWMIVHAGDGSRLPSYHPYGEDCGRCAGTGVPAPLWAASK